jgi:nitrogen regulatory protein PII
MKLKLYLAEIKLRKTKYMGDTTYEMVTRLVRAEDDHDAINKIDMAFERGGPGDDSVSVCDVDLFETIE